MSEEKKIYRWGVIGLGKIARKFATDLRTLPNARLYAVASSSQERADAFAAEFGCEQAFDSYEALAQCPEIDIVYIATPHVQHYDCTLLCLHNKKAVLCEKPFAMSSLQAQEMVATARKNQVFLMEALWSFFIPGVAAALKMAREGAVGPIHSLKSDFGFYSPYKPESRLFNPQLGGGALLDIGIYPALLSLAVFGKPAEADMLASATFTRDGVDESCAFLMKYPDNRLSISHATIAANTPVEATLYGSEGMIHLHTRWHHTPKVTVTRFDEAEPQVYEFPFDGWGYQFEAAHVMDCLDAGRTESDIVPLAFTLDLNWCLEVLLEKMGVKYG